MKLTGNFRHVYNKLSWPPYAIVSKIYKVITSIEPGWFLQKHLAVQISFSLITNYFLFNLRNDLMQSFGKMNDYVFKTLSAEAATEQDWQDFQSSSFSILQPLLFYIGIQLVINTIENLYDSWLDKHIQQKVTAKVFNNHQVGIKLANSETTAGIVRNLPNDIANISNSGLFLIRNMSKTTQSATLSFVHLSKLSNHINILGIKIPDLMLASFLYSVIKQLITTPLTIKIAAINSELTIQRVRTNTIMAHDFSNVKPIFTARAQNTVAQRHKELRNNTNFLAIKLSLVKVVHQVVMECAGYINLICKNIFMGYKVFTKAIMSDQIYSAWTHFNNVDNFFAWVDGHQTEIANLEQPLIRVQTFLDAEKQIINQPARILYNRGGAALELRDLTLFLNGDKLVTIPNFTFKPGDRYVFSGKAGSGKSSIIAKINGIIHDGIDASGEITIPEHIYKTVMLTQDDYFPAHTSLLSVLCLPGKIPEDGVERATLIKRAEELLIESGLGREINLEAEKTNYAAELSGGQKKKIKIVSAILQQPDLLLLDEVFTGQDEASIRDIQRMILKYLPNAMIIAVDHHPDESRGFYTSHHAVENKAVTHKWGMKGDVEVCRKEKVSVSLSDVTTSSEQYFSHTQNLLHRRGQITKGEVIHAVH